MTALQIVKTNLSPQPHFGLHKIDNIWYLFQDTMPDGCSIVTMNDAQDHISGFNTDEAGIGGACTHNINPFLIHRRIPKCQWATFTTLAKDPLVELFLPVPHDAKSFKKRVLILDVAFNPSWFFLVKNLERLSSPLFSKVDSWVPELQHKRISDLQLTNLQPQVYSLTPHDLDARMEKHILALAQAADNSTLGRPVVLMANTRMCRQLELLLGDLAEPLNTKLFDRSLVTNIMHFPFEHMGSRVMGYYCLNGELVVS